MSSLAGGSLEGWRLRRASARQRLRPLHAVIDGSGAIAAEVSRRLADNAVARLSGVFASTDSTEAGAVADVVVICHDGEPAASFRQRVREVSLQAARACPLTAVVIAADGAMPLCVEAVRASGLPPWLVLAPGGMPLASSMATRWAASVGVAAGQVDVPVVGGEATGDHAGLRVLDRYITVAGIPAREIRGATDGGVTPPNMSPSPRALAAATARLARAVLQDSRRVLCCAAWVEGSFGLPGGFVSVPVPVGARGAEAPLPLRLTLEERALLQRVAAR